MTKKLKPNLRIRLLHWAEYKVDTWLTQKMQMPFQEEFQAKFTAGDEGVNVKDYKLQYLP